MDLSVIYNSGYSLIFLHPFISIGIAAALAVLIYLKPKEVLRVLAIFATILIIIYLLNFMWGATKTGFMEKEKMVHKNPPMPD